MRRVWVDSQESFQAMVAALNQAEKVVLDLETTDLQPFNEEIASVQLCDARLAHKEDSPDFTKHDAYMIPLRMKRAHNYPDEAEVWKFVDALLTSKPVVAHQATFEWKWLKHHRNIDINIVDDTMIATHFHDGERHEYGLKPLDKEFLGLDMVSFQELIKLTNSQDFSEVPVEQALPYGTDDVVATAGMLQLLGDEPHTKFKFNYELCIEMCKVLGQMELVGIMCEAPTLKEMSDRLDTEIARLYKEIYDDLKTTPDKCQIESPKQLGVALQASGVVLKEVTAKGQFKTGKEVLEKLEGQYPVIAKIGNWRRMQSTKKMFTDKLPTHINQHTGRIHSSFWQTRVPTGRIASDDPNLQNQKKGDEFDVNIRNAFVATPGWEFLDCDYSQIELRVYATDAKIDPWIHAFNTGGDIHMDTACSAFQMPSDQVDEMIRRKAKIINFGLIYGMSPYGLAQQLKASEEEAREWLDRFFAKIPQVKVHEKKAIDEARRQGRGVYTYFGRWRSLPALGYFEDKGRYLTREERMEYSKACRSVINSRVQGTAADIFKISMVRLHRMIQKEFPDTLRMVLTVHDQVIFERKLDGPSRDDVVKRIKDAMEIKIPGFVPMVVDVKYGQRWGSLQKYKTGLPDGPVNPDKTYMVFRHDESGSVWCEPDGTRIPEGSLVDSTGLSEAQAKVRVKELELKLITQPLEIDLENRQDLPQFLPKLSDAFHRFRGSTPVLLKLPLNNVAQGGPINLELMHRFWRENGITPHMPNWSLHQPRACNWCTLREHASQVVVNEGKPGQLLMFIGRNPGRDEDKQGRPFVGASGKVVQELIESMGLTRDSVAIANTCMCHSLENMEPFMAQCSACKWWLNSFILYVRPKIIVTLGDLAYKSLYDDPSRSVTKDRLKIHEFSMEGHFAYVLPIWHPGNTIRNPDRMREYLDNDVPFLQALYKKVAEAAKSRSA